MIYAGIGSRETPFEICDVMFRIARKYAQLGWFLRSGGARRADTAFERGATFTGSSGYRSYRAHESEGRHDWEALAKQHHPAWDRCSVFAKLLHARNGAIVLGDTLDDPVQFIVCYTSDGKVSGGTGQAMRIASARNIPIYNLHDPLILMLYEMWLAA